MTSSFGFQQPVKPCRNAQTSGAFRPLRFKPSAAEEAAEKRCDDVIPSVARNLLFSGRIENKSRSFSPAESAGLQDDIHRYFSAACEAVPLVPVFGIPRAGMPLQVYTNFEQAPHFLIAAQRRTNEPLREKGVGR